MQPLRHHIISYRNLEQWIAACSTLIRYCPNFNALDTLWQSILQEAQRYTENAIASRPTSGITLSRTGG